MSEMVQFLNSLEHTLMEQSNVSITENGAAGYRTTGKALLDLNFAVSSLRSVSEEEIVKRFIKAFYEDKLLAVKWLFFASDVRQGMGERRLFRVIFSYLAENHSEMAKAVLTLVPEYNRWDNLWCLLDTKLAGDVIDLVKNQLAADRKNMEEQGTVSLLAKWMPSINASSGETRRLAKLLAAGLGMTNGKYRKILAGLRDYLRVVETRISRGGWEEICYEQVPSRASMLYRNAFLEHDTERRRAYLESLKKGETKIHADVLFPSDIVHEYCKSPGIRRARLHREVDATIEELWKALPDYVQGASNTICVVDGSGSMLRPAARKEAGRAYTRIAQSSELSCMEVANALAIYFSERCSGELNGRYITFSSRPQFVNLKNAATLREKLEIASAYNEVANTNIEAVFALLLETAIQGKLKQEELPETVLVLSDMEFDYCVCDSNDTPVRSDKLFQEIAKQYQKWGYKLPRLVFWNIASRTETIPIKQNELGVALVSGFSPAIMKMVLSTQTDPYECLLEQLNGARYEAVEKALVA